jgi:hypothetical protein
MAGEIIQTFYAELLKAFGAAQQLRRIHDKSL